MNCGWSTIAWVPTRRPFKRGLGTALDSPCAKVARPQSAQAISKIPEVPFIPFVGYQGIDSQLYEFRVFALNVETKLSVLTVTSKWLEIHLTQ
jgi:hypothetical protein